MAGREVWPAARVHHSGLETIGHEDLEIGGKFGSLYFYFHPKEHRFKSIWRNRDAFDNNDGVRPSAEDEDLVPNT
jgi:hypothetical protein